MRSPFIFSHKGWFSLCVRLLPLLLTQHCVLQTLTVIFSLLPTRFCQGCIEYVLEIFTLFNKHMLFQILNPFAPSSFFSMLTSLGLSFPGKYPNYLRIEIIWDLNHYQLIIFCKKIVIQKQYYEQFMLECFCYFKHIFKWRSYSFKIYAQ